LTHLGNEGNENDETGQDYGLLVHDIEFLRDGSGNETTSEDGATGLGDEVGRRGEFVDELRGTFIGRGSRGARHSTTIAAMHSFQQKKH
jgi:hypothetical protein